MPTTNVYLDDELNKKIERRARLNERSKLAEILDILKKVTDMENNEK